MRYVCLIYYDHEPRLTDPAAGCDGGQSECIEHRASLRRAGRLVTAAALEPALTATTVRVREGRVQVADGTGSRSSQRLAGLYLIDARDLNHAIRLAADIPAARVGVVEVRPVRAFPDPDRPAKGRARPPDRPTARRR